MKRVFFGARQDLSIGLVWLLLSLPFIACSSSERSGPGAGRDASVSADASGTGGARGGAGGAAGGDSSAAGGTGGGAERDSGAGGAGASLAMIDESEPNDTADTAQRIDEQARISASSGAGDVEDVFLFVAPTTATYDIVLGDFDESVYEMHVYTEDGSVDATASGGDPVTVDLTAGDELYIDIYVLSDVDQTYTLTIAQSAPPDAGSSQPPDAGGPVTGDRFSWDQTDYYADDPEVGVMEAYLDAEELVISFQRTDGSGFHFIIGGQTTGTYGGSGNVYSYTTASGNVYQNGNASGPQQVVITALGAVGQKIEGTFTITVTLVGCMSCSDTTYEGSFSITRSR